MDFSEFLTKAKTFFRDEDVPMGARVAVAGGIALVLTFPIWSNLSGKKRNVPGVISAVSFPLGGSGLAEPGSRQDLTRAQANELLKKQEKEMKRRAAAENKMLNAIDPAVKTPKKEAVPVAQKAAKNETKNTQNASPFKLLPIPIPVSRGMIQSKDGSIWLSSRNGILFFKDGKLSKAKTILSPNIYDADYNRDMPELSQIASDSENTLYAGFMNGQVMKYKRYEWKVLPQNSERKITAILPKKDKVFLGTQGLLQYNKSLNKVFKNPEHDKSWIKSLVQSSSGETYMSSKRALWRYTADDKDSWEVIWIAPKSDVSIKTISIDKKSLALGTHNGFVRISKQGVVLDRELEKENVYSIIENADGSIWAGTRGNGLRYFDGNRWYSATQAQGISDWVTELLKDSKGRLWIGATGVGVFIANEKKAAKWIKNFPDVKESKLEPLEFSNACEAADSLLGEVALSNQIANKSFDGRGYVFMKGKQVCPRGVGIHHPDGTTAILKNWNLLVLKDNKRSEIVIPKEIPADETNTLFLDSSNRFWLATKKGQLFLFDKHKNKDQDKWKPIEQSELKENPILAIVEDFEGTIWFGSTPKIDKEKQVYIQASLHSYNREGAWHHYDSKDGLVQNSTLAMMLSDKGKIAIGTRAGISILNEYEVTNYGKSQGLNPNQITSVDLDSKERIWFAYSFFGDGFGWIEDESIHRFTSKEGLVSDKILNLALDRHGRVWAQASNGKVGVYPVEYLEKKSRITPLSGNLIRSLPLGNHRDTKK